MKIAIRADSSLEIGVGHIMRCLTLADGLRKRSCEVVFITRDHEGNISSLVEEKGYQVYILEYNEDFSTVDDFPMTSRYDEHACSNSEMLYQDWLGVNIYQDIHQTISVIKGLGIDWLIVDHYAIDYRWEGELRTFCKKIMVVDDLADREHDCDVLIDQTYGRQANDYLALVPESTELLLSTKYALIRPEFLQWRDYSLKRRLAPELKNIFISMGGCDNQNASGRVLQALQLCDLPKGCAIKVVMGERAPWLEKVKELAKKMTWQTEVLTNVRNMAELMSNSDLAIGAAGATSWERCCLGLPSIVVVLAENQKYVARALQQSKAAVIVNIDDRNSMAFQFKSMNKDLLKSMSVFSSELVDGKGVENTINFLFN